MRYRNYISIFLIILLLCHFPVKVSSHPGRTDSTGGHFDRSTGEYHYHHGYPAHQHYDMDGDGIIDCPYKFDDKTDHRSSGSGSGTSSSIDEYSSVYPDKSTQTSNLPKPVSNPPATHSEGRSSMNIFITITLIASAILIIILYFMLQSKIKFADSLMLNHTLELNNQKLHYEKELKHQAEQWSAQKANYEGQLNTLYYKSAVEKSEYSAKIEQLKEMFKEGKAVDDSNIKELLISILSQFPRTTNQELLLTLSKASANDCIGNDMLPLSIPTYREKWGDKYTFTISEKSMKYHRPSCHCCGSAAPINAYTLANTPDACPCQICKPILPDLQWYRKYIRYQSILSRYHIDIENLENTVSVNSSSV